MFFFLAFSAKNITEFCLRTNSAELPKCPETTDIEISSIDDFYSQLTEKSVANLVIISNEENVIKIDSNRLNNSAIDFLGVNNPKIEFILVDQELTQLDDLGFKNIQVYMDSNENVHFHNFYLANTTLSFSKESVNLKAAKVITDLRSISYFDIINVTDFHLTTANLPESNTTIVVRSRLVVQSQKNDSRVDISMNQLIMNFDGTVITFNLTSNSACDIEHRYPNVFMDLYVHNIKRQSESDPIFTLNVTNQAYVDVYYTQYIEDTSPDLRIYLNNSALLSSTSHNCPAQIFVIGNATLDVTKNRNDLSFKALTVVENGKLEIDNTNGVNSINFLSFAAFFGNGVLTSIQPLTLHTPSLSFQDTVSTSGFLQNIEIVDVVSITSRNSTSNIPSLHCLENASLKYEFTPEETGTLSFQDLLFNGATQIEYKGQNKPTKEESVKFVENPQYIVCSPTFNCDDWSYTLSSTDNYDGFTDDTSILQSVCTPINNLICGGYKFVDTPQNIYPTLSYGSIIQHSDIQLNKSTASKIGNFVSSSARKIDISVSEAMTNDVYFGFDGLKNKVDVKIHGLIPININIRIKPEDKQRISILTLSKGIFNFVENNNIDLDYILFDQGSDLSQDTFNHVDFSHCERIGVHIDAIDTFPLSQFPNATIAINEPIDLTYKESTLSFLTTRYPQSIDVNSSDFTQFLALSDGGSLNITKELNTISKPIRAISYGSKFNIQINSDINKDDCLLDLYGTLDINYNSNSKYIPFIFDSGNFTIFIDENNTQTSYSIRNTPTKLNTTTEIKIISSNAKVVFESIDISGQFKLNSANSEINNITLHDNTLATFESTTLQNDITIPSTSTVYVSDCTFNNYVTIQSQTQGRSGVFYIVQSTNSMPKGISIDWDANTIPKEGIDYASYVILSKDPETIGKYKEIVTLKENKRKVNNREITASLVVDHSGIMVLYQAPPDKNQAIYLSLIVASVVLLISFIVGIIIYCCCRRQKKGDARLLSAETLLSLQAQV